MTKSQVNYNNILPTKARKCELDAIKFALHFVAFHRYGVTPTVETVAGRSRPSHHGVELNQLRRGVRNIKLHLLNMVAKGVITDTPSGVAPHK